MADCTWVEVAERAADVDLVVPLGSFEQHGPHLPLDTDTVITVELARRWAAGRPDRMVGPVLTVGASSEHADFPGTVSIGTEVTASLVIEVVRSCRHFRRVVVASWHGGNRDALARAEAVLGEEGIAATFWLPSVPGDAHAGRSETSLMLALAPERVSMDRARPGVVSPLADLMPRLRREGVRAVSPNGVLGDPREATAAEGRELMGTLLAQLEEVCE